MVDTLQPREYFPISRLLSDPYDTETYYVQAIIRNATSGTTIATVNLTSQGNRLYANTWQTPADPTGRGLFITITTSVYTDSAYTTKSDIYGEESDTFVVFDRFNALQSLAMQIGASLSSGGSSDVDYKKIKKIMKDVIADFEKRLIARETARDAMPKEKIDLGPLTNQVTALSRAIAAEFSKPKEKVDLGPLSRLVEMTAQKIEEKAQAIIASIPEATPVTDLTSVTAMLEELGQKKSILENLDGVDFTDLKEKLAKLQEMLQVMDKFGDTVVGLMGSKFSPKEDKPESKPVTPRSVNRFGRVINRNLNNE